MQLFARLPKRITWIILKLCSLVRRINVGTMSPHIFHFYITIKLFHQFTFSLFTIHHFIHFAPDNIRNYSGKMSKLVHQYQEYEESLLCQFAKVELIQDGQFFQVTLSSMNHFPSLMSFQEHTHELERKGLSQKKNKLVLSIFGNFDLILWWESKAG